MAWRSPDFYQNEIGHGKSTDMNTSPVIGALSEQGSAPLFQDRYSQCSPTIGNILAIVVAVLIGLFIARQLGWGIEEFYMGQVVR